MSKKIIYTIITLFLALSTKSTMAFNDKRTSEKNDRRQMMMNSSSQVKLLQQILQEIKKNNTLLEMSISQNQQLIN